MGKRSVSDANHHNNGGPSNKKTKYNNGQDHHLNHNHNHQLHHNSRHHHHHNQERSTTHYRIENDNRSSTPNALHNNLDKESPKPEFHLSRELVNGTILTDLMRKQWRIGNPIGKGSFGEIFLASDNVSIPVTNENAKYVVKIEPHSNGPLFVEIHCLLNTAKPSDNNPLPPGMPAYIASGSHYFKNTRYRFLILQRFDRDLHSIIKNRKVDQKSILIIAVQILEVLEHLHDKGYCHSDIKAENLMISKCTYHKNLLIQLNNALIKNEINHHENNCNDSNNSDDNEEDGEDDEDDSSSNQKRYQLNNRYLKKMKQCSNDDNDDDESNDDNDDENDDDYEPKFQTLSGKNRKRISVPYSGSNPVRSCRISNKQNSASTTTYQEMVSTHYLRPTKKINYSQFFGDDTSKSSGDDDSTLDEYITRHRHRLSKEEHSKSSNSLNNFNNDNSNSNSTSASVSHNSNYNSSSNGHHNSRNNRKYQNHESTINNQQQEQQQKYNRNDWITEDRIFLIDFGLASKFMDSNGVHRPFCMDQRRAHDGTLEFTSRDAHMGAHSRRSDLECLGYNLIFWSQGYLPWKENAAQQQHEKVHWMKEYLMTDVKEMLKHIYGKQVPKYLGEYMHYVGQLSFNERPNYDKCKRMFQNEYQRLIANNYNSAAATNKTKNNSNNPHDNVNKMTLNLSELIKNSIDIKEECENNNLFEMKNSVKMIMKNLGVIMPFRENSFLSFNNSTSTNSPNRVSPKNLRSKSDKLSLTASATSNKHKNSKKRKKFSWSEILSQDPDQIARERAEKEFEREEMIIDETPIRYKGKPTYAILEIQNRIKFKDRLATNNSSILNSDLNDSIDYTQIKGFTKPMIDILMKKRKSSLLNNTPLGKMNMNSTNTVDSRINGVVDGNDNQKNTVNAGNNKNQRCINSSPLTPVASALQTSLAKLTRPRTKAGLRTVITPTKRGLDYNDSLIKRRAKRDIHCIKSSAPSSTMNNYRIQPMTNIISTDEESCSSMNSAVSSNISVNNKKTSSSSSSRSSAVMAPLLSSARRTSSIRGYTSSGLAELSENDDDEEEREEEKENEEEDDEDENYDDSFSNESNDVHSKNVFTTTTATKRRKKNVNTKKTTNNGVKLSGKTKSSASKKRAKKSKTKRSSTSKKKKRKSKAKGKKSINDYNYEENIDSEEDYVREQYNDDDDGDDSNDYEDELSSDYEYYSVVKGDIDDSGHIPVATFRKRLKRTRSG